VLNVKKYIVAFLLVIFLFPTAFQPLHILWHRNHGYHCKHDSCRAEESKGDSSSDAETLSHEKSVCQICDFKIAITGIPVILVYISIIPEIGCKTNEAAVQQLCLHLPGNKTPRAPPHCIS